MLVQIVSTTEAEAVALLGEARLAKRLSASALAAAPEALLCDRTPLLRIVNRSNAIIRYQQVAAGAQVFPCRCCRVGVSYDDDAVGASVPHPVP